MTRPLGEFVLASAVKPFRPLTPAQTQIADLVARGLGYKRIANRLGISWHTVYFQVRRISDLLPDDGLGPRERVQIWALCVEIAKQNVSSAA